MKSFRHFGCLVLALVQTAAFASVSNQNHLKNEAKEHCDFIPKNDLKIPVGANLQGGITEDEFNDVINKVVKFYEPIVKQKGGKLKVNRLWTDDTVNASAQRQGKYWVLNMYGGLARHAETTVDGFALVVCHELGHHLGGFPQYGTSQGTADWASNEGQSDYFATMKCFRRVFEKENNSEVISAMSVPSIVSDQCATTFKSTAEIDLCIRGSMGGKVLANLLWSLANANNPLARKPSFETPDQTQVQATKDGHPKAQCRLDTYFAGSICSASYTDDFGETDPVTGACAMENGDTSGTRPLCWYKPIE